MSSAHGQNAATTIDTSSFPKVSIDAETKKRFDKMFTEKMTHRDAHSVFFHSPDIKCDDDRLKFYKYLVTTRMFDPALLGDSIRHSIDNIGGPAFRFHCSDQRENRLRGAQRLSRR